MSLLLLPKWRELFMIKSGKALIVGLVFFMLVLVIYIVKDNNRITIVEQEVFIEDLPKELDGFTVLQVTDLHEKEFGRGQSRLLKKINSIRYDAILFTGDMLDSRTSTNYSPYYSLIEGVDNKEVALYVPGNSDPVSYVLDETISYEKHEFDIGMEERGVQLLEAIHTVKFGEANVHFVNFEMAILNPSVNIEVIDNIIDPTNQNYKHYLAHQREMLEDLKLIESFGDSDIIIALNHYPVVDNRLDLIANDPDPKITLPNIDLIFAGHYHGGQIRLPFVGALFVPEPYYERSGLFPPKDRVKGLWEYRGIKQYVSAGLGSSDAIPLLKFRFLNPPEINIIKLKRAE